MKIRMKLIALAAAMFFFSTTIALAQDFSADMVNRSKAGTMKGKIFISKDKTRMETGEGITISRMDKKVVWVLMPQEKMYMEQAFDPAKAVTAGEKVNGEIERRKLGQEKIDGRMADKYEVVYTQGRKQDKMFIWVVGGIAMPVKSAAVDNSWSVEYRNIKMGKNPDSLFELPAGYGKFAVPSMRDMLKGFGK